MKRFIIAALFLFSIPAYAQHSVTLKCIPNDSLATTLYKGTVSGGPYTKLSSPIDCVGGYVDSIVIGGTTYYYVVTATDAEGRESVYSNMVTAVVPVTPPPPKYTLFSNPTSFTFAWQTGAAIPASQSTTVGDNAPGCEPITITTDATWLTATSASTCTTPAVVKVGVSPAALGVGSFTGHIIIKGPSEINTLSIPATLTVTAPPIPKATCTKTNPPVCTITGTSAGQSGTITIQPGGTVVPWSRP